MAGTAVGFVVVVDDETVVAVVAGGIDGLDWWVYRSYPAPERWGSSTNCLLLRTDPFLRFSLLAWKNRKLRVMMIAERFSDEKLGEVKNLKSSNKMGLLKGAHYWPI